MNESESERDREHRENKDTERTHREQKKTQRARGEREYTDNRDRQTDRDRERQRHRERQTEISQEDLPIIKILPKSDISLTFFCIDRYRPPVNQEFQKYGRW